ncbi:hypothetical protein BpHYR1_045395 [Brachionus plicatilis]|uniref:Uncharacterized protein n=1 Tax=Brachionus plicatilis TaxID=10195 RepID=A0A3M7SLC2_BRAPC|nr:hypothetical protein BpHYR1_045395 [Brachionus plicatilis]
MANNVSKTCSVNETKFCRLPQKVKQHLFHFVSFTEQVFDTLNKILYEISQCRISKKNCEDLYAKIQSFISKNLYTLGLTNAIDLPYIRNLLLDLDFFGDFQTTLF